VVNNNQSLSKEQTMSITRTFKSLLLILATTIAALAFAVPGRASAAGVSASPNPSPAGSAVTVSGSGFDPGEVIEVNFAGDLVSTTADANGSFQTPLTINPTVPTGSHPLDANGNNGNWASGTLTVSAPAPAPTPPPAPVGGQGTVSASPDPSPAGSTVSVSGSGFLPGETVEVNFAGDIVTTTADGSGNYSTPFTINTSVPVGGHPLDANGSNGSWANSSLSVSAPAPVPAPATPAPALTPAKLTPVPAAPTPTPAPTPSPTPAPTPAAPTTTVVDADDTTDAVSGSDTKNDNNEETIGEASALEDRTEATESSDDDLQVGAPTDDEVSGNSPQSESANAVRNTDSNSGGINLLDSSLLLFIAGIALAAAFFLALNKVRRNADEADDNEGSSVVCSTAWPAPNA
jgi:hypothetical protein